ncbi:MAG: gamma-glutamyltransferase family protein, partial [Candidatus Thorarchaeota archaeon]
MFWRRSTGRSDVLSHKGMVASSQPLATQAGLDILKAGGNAVDAGIAVAAVLDVVEPFSTGCGGDAFVLIHIPRQNIPLSYNGSGRSGSLATLDDLTNRGWTEMPLRGGPSVSVPGAMHLWYTLNKEHGALEFSEVLRYAIRYAREGFPVSPVIAQQWQTVVSVLRGEEARSIFSIDGMAPSTGACMRNPQLAKVFEEVSIEGLDVFYNGWVAEAIVETVAEDGGFLSLDDLADHATEKTIPISSEYRGVEVFEHPPNGQGFAALMMLNIMERFDFSSFGPISAERYHLMIEAKKLAYDDLHRHNADPSFYDVPLKTLLSKEYAISRATLIQT